MDKSYNFMPFPYIFISPTADPCLLSGHLRSAANSFTHNRYTRDHFENVAGILLPMHQYICNSIYSRYVDGEDEKSIKQHWASFVLLFLCRLT
jgi:hypothetical protein